MPDPHIHTPVLVVEDDPVVAANHQALVESCGYDVIIARNGEEALEALRQRPFRMIISDWQMPVMDGLALCHEVRALKLPHYVYFILVTQKNDKVEFLQAMNSGVDDFIVKPLHRSTLYIRLRVAARILGFQEALVQVNKLLPVCMYCGSIQARPAVWMPIVEFLEGPLERNVSHGICPSCFARGVPHKPVARPLPPSPRNSTP